jgi:hypothetical protein
MSRAKWILSIIAIVAVIALFLTVRHEEYKHSIDQNMAKMGNDYARDGVMPVEDFQRINNIAANVQQSGSISNADLEWSLNFLHSHTAAGYTGEMARANLLYALEPLKNFPRDQEQEIFQAVLPLLGNAPEYNDGLDKVRATIIMGKLKDPRAVPYLTLLLRKPPPLSTRATEALANIEHTTGSKGA